MRLLCLFTLYALFVAALSAQPSFSKYLDASTSYYIYNTATYDSTDIGLLIYDYTLHSPNLYYARFTPPYENVQAYRIHSSNVTFSFPFSFRMGEESFISQHIFGYNGGGNEIAGACIFYMDTSLQNHWIYYKPYFIFSAFEQYPSGNIVSFYSVTSTLSTSPYSSPNIIEGFVITPQGQTLVKKGISFVIEGHNDYSSKVEKVVIDEEKNRAYVLFSYIEAGIIQGSALLSLDSSLNLLSAAAISGAFYSDMVISNDGNKLFLLGKHEGAPGQGISESVLLTSLDTSLQVEWAKRYFAEHFEYKQATLNALPTGGLGLAYSTDGAYPTILAKLDEGGNLIEQTGYPFYEPMVNVLTDGSLSLAGNQSINEDGNISFQLTISKTDATGNIDGCTIFSTCLLTQDDQVVTTEIEINTLSIDPLNEINLSIDPWNFNFEDACHIPPTPNPAFSIPDTICIGECIIADSLSNQLAHGVEWHIVGPNGLDEISNDFYFMHCLEKKGTYQLTQTVWFLGCPYSYSKQLVVLEELAGSIEPEGILCHAPPAELSIDANRPLVSYLWNSGAGTTQTFEVSESGLYEVEVTDGYCTLKDTAKVKFLQDTLNQGSPLQLPEDTSLCKQHLPYLLHPYSPYNEIFSLSGFQSDSFFIIWSEGSYDVQVNILGCLIAKEFTLKLNDCEAPLFMPTAFSPNGDGINDLYLPQGKHLEGISLEIYDRWGGLLYQTTTPPFSWNGKTKNNKKLSPGVYISCFQYHNLLSQETEMQCREIHLIR